MKSGGDLQSTTGGCDFRSAVPHKRDQRQIAHQIVVASSADALARQEGDLWDTGRVE